VDDSPGTDPVDVGTDDRTGAGQRPFPDVAGSADRDRVGVDGAGGAPVDDAVAEGPGDSEGEHPEGKDPLRFNNWMKRSATGAVMTGIAVGLQQALEVPRKQPAFVIVASDEPDDADGPIELRFDPDSPAATVAVIRTPPPAGSPGAPTPPS
jgi:hypothetical protein